jgi:hypothetical protein
MAGTFQLSLLVTRTFPPNLQDQEQSPWPALLTHLVVPQEVNGNWNRTKA